MSRRGYFPLVNIIYLTIPKARPSRNSRGLSVKAIKAPHRFGQPSVDLLPGRQIDFPEVLVWLEGYRSFDNEPPQARVVLIRLLVKRLRQRVLLKVVRSFFFV